MPEAVNTKKGLNRLPGWFHSPGKNEKLPLFPTVRNSANNVLNTCENKLYFIKTTREDARLQIFLPNYREPTVGNQGPPTGFR